MENFVKNPPATVPSLVWLVIPVAFILIEILLEAILPREALKPMLSEGGPHEAFQFLIALAAFFVAFKTLFEVRESWLRLWILCAVLGCLYIAGEEISWGQWVFGWVTPEFWTGVNDQQETNLHNTSAWLDQKPRLLLFIGIIVGGLVIPAMRRMCPQKLPRKFEILYPSDVVVVTSLGVTVPYFIQETAELFKFRFLERVSEVQELYMYYFVLIYLLDFRKRIISKK
jgi:hypothetical protein